MVSEKVFEECGRWMDIRQRINCRACLYYKLIYAPRGSGEQTRGPRAMIHSPELNSHCNSADALQLSSSSAIFSPYKSTCMGMQIWPCYRKVEGHPRIIIWLNLVDLRSWMLYTKIQPWSFLGSRAEDFRCFSPYMPNTGMKAILLNDVEPF